jgi:hypothetical protein
VKDPKIHLIIDTSAALAYAATSLNLGETIAEVVEEDGLFAVPSVCLAEASRLVDNKLSDGIALLGRHSSGVVLPALAEDWTALAAWTRILGRVDLAAALVEATDRPACYVMSSEPDLYGDDTMPVIGI